MKKIKIGIVGGTGYTAGELLRILLHHPNAVISYIYSTSQAGKAVSSIHTDLTGETDLLFTDKVVPVDVVFLCLGHGISREFLTNQIQDNHTRIIDLGNDFRMNVSFKNGSIEREFFYGLPEINRDQIKSAASVANPGCFATAIQLALLPLVSKNYLASEVHIHAITGSTGAGRSLSETSHFSYRQNNISVYKVFSHQHLGEINKTLTNYGSVPELNFVPVRGDFTRGIFATLYTKCNLNEEDIINTYYNFYQSHPFTHISLCSVSLKDVINTNKCLLNLKKYGDKLFITSCIDNLLKGASGQAVQNMNLMFGLDEVTGLNLKSTGF